jgi:hypothetical protein
MRLISLVVVTILLVGPAYAATIGAANCSESAVQSAISAAKDGDSVLVPAGNCTWSSELSITKAITLQGAGIDQTRITCNLATYDGMIKITAKPSLNTRVTGFSFDGKGYVFGVSGSYDYAGRVRLDHMKYTGTGYGFAVFYDDQPGLIDHCQVSVTCPQEIIHVYGTGASDWIRPDNMGTDEMLIVEDNVFTGSGSCPSSLTSFDGARWTFRHNSVNSAIVDGHPNYFSWDHAVRQVEIYANTWVSPIYSAIDLKGGTGVIYNNTATGGSGGIGLYVLAPYCGTNSQGCCCLSNLDNAACKQRPGFGYNYLLDPIYIWGNTNMAVYLSDNGCNDCDSTCGGHPDPSSFIRAGTEYYSTQKTGYTPFAYPHPLQGTTCLDCHYIRQGATGSNNGNDWTNAWTSLPATLQRSHTYYIADGSYGRYVFDDPESGSQYITIRKATAADHGSDVGWQAAYGDGVADFTGDFEIQSSYLTLDGATGGGPGSWTSGHGFRFQLASGEAIHAYEPLSNIRLVHIEVTQPGETKKMGGLDAWKNPFEMTDFYIGYCYFHHISGLPIFARAGSRWLFEYNYFSDPCGVSLYDYNQHCEHLVSHDADDVTIRYNIMKDGRSTGILVNNDLRADRWDVYGNVLQNDEGSAIISAAADPADTAYDWNIFNNLFIGPGPLKMIITTGKAYNNIYLDGGAYPPAGMHDYNYYADVSFEQCDMQLAAHENGVKLYPNDCDSYSPAADPIAGIANDDYRLNAALSGWPGTDVCSIVSCDGTKTFNKDWNDIVRGSDGTWDRGALEYTSGQQCAHSADSDCNNCIDLPELNSYVNQWLAGTVQIRDMMDAIRMWKAGC